MEEQSLAHKSSNSNSMEVFQLHGHFLHTNLQLLPTLESFHSNDSSSLLFLKPNRFDYNQFMIIHTDERASI